MQIIPNLFLHLKKSTLMHKGKKMLKVKARPEPDKDQKCQKKTNLSQITAVMIRDIMMRRGLYQ